jgi:hypothetical protein
MARSGGIEPTATGGNRRPVPPGRVGRVSRSRQAGVLLSAGVEECFSAAVAGGGSARSGGIEPTVTRGSRRPALPGHVGRAPHFPQTAARRTRHQESA